jgi:hypothetical protein
MEQICHERGLLEVLGRNGKVVGICGECKKSEAAREKAAKEAKARQEEAEGSGVPGTGFIADAGAEAEAEDLERPTNCCMRRILSCEKDFRSEKPLLQVIIERRGHKCLFLPKFHCELNPIEMVWAQTKRGELNAHVFPARLTFIEEFRDLADGTFPTAKKLVPQCLDNVTTTNIRRYFQHCHRYLDAYQ